MSPWCPLTGGASGPRANVGGGRRGAAAEHAHLLEGWIQHQLNQVPNGFTSRSPKGNHQGWGQLILLQPYFQKLPSCPPWGNKHLSTSPWGSSWLGTPPLATRPAASACQPGPRKPLLVLNPSSQVCSWLILLLCLNSAVFTECP